jgi:hypothetical protein
VTRISPAAAKGLVEPLQADSLAPDLLAILPKNGQRTAGRVPREPTKRFSAAAILTWHS